MCIKQMHVCPETGIIYYGSVSPGKNILSGRKTDVTAMACRAVAEHLIQQKKSILFLREDGRSFSLHVELLEEK